MPGSQEKRIVGAVREVLVSSGKGVRAARVVSGLGNVTLQEATDGDGSKTYRLSGTHVGYATPAVHLVNGPPSFRTVDLRP